MPIARSTEVDPLGIINLIGSNLTDRYPPGSILKELVQNADDAGARNVVVGWTPGPIYNAQHPLLQGPALFVVNDGKFEEKDAHAICRFGQNYKFGEKAVIGKFGLGLKSVFHLCEAFFYLSSMVDSERDKDGLFNNLASPWAKTEYHRGWNTVEKADLQLLRELLRPHWSELGEHWFALWLPLRRNELCNGARFIGRFDGDSNMGPPELSGTTAAKEIGCALPLLNFVNSIRFWDIWEPDIAQPSAHVWLETVSTRSRFREWVNGNSDLSIAPASGRYFIATDQPVSVDYAIVQSWSADLLKLTEYEDWPRSFVLTGGQQPDKALPHGAVILARRADCDNGRLDRTTAVFLPLELSSGDTGSAEFMLTLHGCFFVDPGRRHALYRGNDVRGEWNQRLIREGVYPLIVPAVEALAAGAPDSTVVGRMTAAISTWLDAGDEDEGKAIRKHVCREQSWIYRWHPKGSCWTRVDRAMRILEIPSFGTDPAIPSSAMPGLADLTVRVALTPAGMPRLMAEMPASWDDEDLASVLRIRDAESLFNNDGVGLDYLGAFLSGLGKLQGDPVDALLFTCRIVFSTTRGAELEKHRALLARIVSHVPSTYRRGLSLGGNWPEEMRRQVCGVSPATLILPDDFDAEDPGTATIPTNEAVAMLTIVDKSMSSGRNVNPAPGIIRAAQSATEVLRATCDLRLWIVQRLVAQQQNAIVCTFNVIQSFHERRAAFAGPVTDWIRDVAAATGSDLIVVPEKTADVLFPTSGLLHADLKGALDHLEIAPSLSIESDRVPLLRRLLANQPQEEEIGRWRWAVRYLLHGDPNWSADENLFQNAREEGAMARLVEAAVSTPGQRLKILPDGDLLRQLNSEHRKQLRILPLDQHGVAKLLAAVVDSLRVEFTTDERDHVLRALADYPQIVRDLPLHDRVDGRMVRATDGSFWQGKVEPGSLLPHMVLLRPREDPVLAAIQKKAHPQELTSEAVIRLALKVGAPKHVNAILYALRSSNTLDDDVRTSLAKESWLPLASGGEVAPVDVLHDVRFGEALASALKLITPVIGDPIASNHLPLEVQEHPGFGALVRRLFPGAAQLMERAGAMLKRDSRFLIGLLDLRTQDERKEWLAAFDGAPSDVMAVQGLIARLEAVDSDLCVSRLLPPLREGQIPTDRLLKILAYLRNRHRLGQGNRASLLRVHNEYLKLAASNPSVFESLLPRLQLLNEDGDWCDPATLCIAQGLDPACTLHPEQQLLIRELTSSQLRPPTSFAARTREGYSTGFADTAPNLREYFREWRHTEEIAGWAGALLSVLGDNDSLPKLANEFLAHNSPGRTCAYVRTKLDLDSDTTGRQRVLVAVEKAGTSVSVTSLLGQSIVVRMRTDFDSLLIDSKLIPVDPSVLPGVRVYWIRLRSVAPGGLPPDSLRDVVVRTGNLILSTFYGASPRISFEAVLDEFRGDDIFGVQVAQESFLNWAQYSLRFLGLTGTRNEQLHDLLGLADAAVNRRSEEHAMKSAGTKRIQGDAAVNMEKQFRDRLRELVTGNLDVQHELLAAVRRKIQEFRYELRSVLFELFQNADDACVELGRTSEASVFACESNETEVIVVHNGRAINRPPSIATNDPIGYRHDLRRMLSLGHSDKASGPVSEDLTGRFGLGFKSVFLVSDRPKIVSGRLALEIVGGVYPHTMDHTTAEELRQKIEAVGMPRSSSTIFQLAPREASISLQVAKPFQQLVHWLLVFAKQIRTIRWGTDSRSWTDQTIIETGHCRVVLGALQPFDRHESCPPRAVVIRCGQLGDVLFGLNDRGFFRVPDSVPSIWVTAPTTEHHAVGYLVNAPLDLDVGRCQVTWNASANTNRLDELAVATGDAMIALFDQGLGSLGLADGPTVWSSLWEIVSSPGKRKELHESFMWGKFGVARRLFTDRPALPTGIRAPQYEALTSIPSIRCILGGVLDEQESGQLVAQVAEWPGFTRYRQGSIVSERNIWRWLRGDHKPERVDMATIVGNELRDKPDVDVRMASRLGQVIDRTLLRSMEAGTGAQYQEFKKLEPTLQEDTRFLSRAGSWHKPSHLLILTEDIPRHDEGRLEEVRRAAFAPADRVLASDYDRAGVAFFLACREQLMAPVQVMARWALSADTESRQLAVLKYLQEGEQRDNLLEELHRQGVRETWLGKSNLDTNLKRAGFDDRQQTATLVKLGLVGPPPSPLPMPLPPQGTIAKIAAWWRTNADAQVQHYNRLIYPGGVPRLTLAGPGADTGSRIEWLKLFIAGIAQTLGRVTDAQNREFQQLCDSERWLIILADPVAGPREWLGAVERYIDRQQGEGIKYNYWLRHFVGIATVSRYLDAYAESFLAVDRFEGRFAPRDVLSPRNSRQFQFGGPNAPSLAPILGIGACLVLRELIRMGFVTRKDVYPYCFAPVRRLCLALERLGWQDDKNSSAHLRSSSIHRFIAEHYPSDPSFGNAFDIPMLMYMKVDPSFGEAE